MHGDWNKLFTMLRKAAIDAWEFIKKNVPIFGEIESLVNKIKGGNWKGAFLQIWKAAVDTWEAIKKAVPFFAGAEVFFRQLFGGNISGAFNTLAAGIKTGLDAVFGKDLVGSLQEKIGIMVNTAKNLFNQLAFDLNAPGGAISMIKDGFAKLGSGDVAGGLGGIAAGIQKGIMAASNALNNWVLQNFGINLTGLLGEPTR